MDLACHTAGKRLDGDSSEVLQSPVWYLNYQEQLLLLLPCSNILPLGGKIIYPFLASRRVVVFSIRKLLWKDTGCVLTEDNCGQCDLAYPEEISWFSFEWRSSLCMT